MRDPPRIPHTGKEKSMERELTKGRFPIEKFSEVTTPFYYYDTALLRETLRTINDECKSHDNFNVHYAVKANANPKVLNIISQAGLGAARATGKSTWHWMPVFFASTWKVSPN